MGISGLVAGGAQDALLELLAQRRLQEQLAEQQRMNRVREELERAQMGQQAEQFRVTQDRLQRGEDRDAARDLAETLSPGELTEDAAGTLRKYKGTAGRVTSRKTIDARPIAGTAPLDASGPQEFSVLEPTPQQAKQQFAESSRRQIGDLFARGAGEAERRKAAAEALKHGVDVPNALLEPTTEEVIKLREQERLRDRGEWKWRQDYNESQMRSRPQAQPTRTQMTPGQSYSATRQLRNDFVRETAAAREVVRQLGQMRAGMAAVRAGDKAAGSQAVLVTFQKILDPTSVVRESEYARSAAGQSILSRMEGAVSRLMAGGAGVPDDELAKFVALGEQFAQNQQASAQEAADQIRGIAEDYGLNPDRIVREDNGAEPTPAPAPGAVIEYVRDPKTGRLVRKQ